MNALGKVISDTISNLPDSIHKVSAITESANNSPFSTNSIIGYVCSGIIGLAIGTLYSLFIQEYTQNFLIKLIPSLFRKLRTLNGMWIQTWTVDGNSYPKENSSEFKLKQRWNKIYGSFSVTDNNGIVNTYILKGKIIDNRYIQGLWYDKFQGYTYHGTFLLSIGVNMNYLEGKWIGTARHNEVKSDSRKWERKTKL